MKKICTIILAAGKGTRLKSDKPKVMHEILGLPLLLYPIRVAEAINSSVIAVIGHGREIVGPYLEGLSITSVVQDPPLGTGHAVLQTTGILSEKDTDDIIIIPGDMPLIEKRSIEGLIDSYHTTNADMGILTARLPNPFGYGRIIRDKHGYVTSIIEEQETSDEQKLVNEINTGVYILKKGFLLDAVKKISPDNSKGEFYLTDIVSMANKAVSFEVSHYNEAHGINSRKQLAFASSVMQERINNALMLSGVGIIDPKTAWISPLASISPDVDIWPNVHILGQTSIQSNVRIMPNSWICDSSIGNNCVIGQGSIINGVNIITGGRISPYSILDKNLPQ